MLYKQLGEEVNIANHTAHCWTVVSNAIKKEDEAQIRLSSRLIDELPAPQCRTLHRIVTGGASGWLTVLPLHEEGYDMSATQFRDQLAIRYHHEPVGLPASCDGCVASFSLQHGLDCAKGGLVKKGHNDLRDTDALIADTAWGGVTIEPILIPENDKRNRPMIHTTHDPSRLDGETGLGRQPGGIFR